MLRKIVVDSSADLTELPHVSFASAALKITAGDKTYVDDGGLDVVRMVEELKGYKGRSVTACPAPHDYLTAFGDADEVFCVTITSALSGSNSAAQVAAREYEKENPGRRVWVIDTLSAGPEVALVAEYLARRTQEGASFDELCADVKKYLAHTHLVFSLQSIRNLANNGRTSPAVAALVGLLGIRIVGQASDKGELQQTAKCRGEKRALGELVASMKTLGWKGGRVRIHHCLNEAAAAAVKKALHDIVPKAAVIIAPTRGLCSFYAEEGGLLIGFEG